MTEANDKPGEAGIAPGLAEPPSPRPNLFARHMRTAFLAGLLTSIPLFVTLFILLFVYNEATLFTRPIAHWLVPTFVGIFKGPPPATDDAALKAYNATLDNLQTFTSPILAMVISLLAVYVLGLLSIFTVGRQILNRIEHFIENLPLIKGIYGTTKQVIGVFRKGGGGAGFQRVVLVQFPGQGMWTVGFVTNTVTDTSTGTRFVCVFIPMTPNPTSGFFQLFAVDAVRDTDWSVDQGIKIVLSGGLLAPSHLDFGKSTPNITAAAVPVTTQPLTGTVL